MYAVTDEELLYLLENEEFEKLAELAKFERIKRTKVNFVDGIKNVIKKNDYEVEVLQEINRLLFFIVNNCMDLVVNINEVELTTPVGFGGYSVVFKGKLRHLDVAIKKQNIFSFGGNDIVD